MPRELLPDRLWQLLKPLIPQARRRRQVQSAGRKPSEPKAVVRGIIFVLRTGVPWKDLPATGEFPSGHTCRRFLLRWHREGIWENLLNVIHAELNAQEKIDWSRAIVDSGSVRAPHGGKKTGPSPVDRRKLGSKHHVITDGNGIPLASELTGANRHDITQLLPLVNKIRPVHGKVGKPRSRPDIVQGDRGYDSEPHRRALRKRG